LIWGQTQHCPGKTNPLPSTTTPLPLISLLICSSFSLKPLDQSRCYIQCRAGLATLVPVSRGVEYVNRQTDRHTDRQTDRQTYRQTDRHTYIHTYIHTDIHTDKHTYIHTEIQPGTQGVVRTHCLFCHVGSHVTSYPQSY